MSQRAHDGWNTARPDARSTIRPLGRGGAGREVESVVVLSVECAARLKLNLEQEGPARCACTAVFF